MNMLNDIELNSSSVKSIKNAQRKKESIKKMRIEMGQLFDWDDNKYIYGAISKERKFKEENGFDPKDNLNAASMISVSADDVDFDEYCQKAVDDYDFNEMEDDNKDGDDSSWLQDRITDNSLSSGLYEVNIPKKLNNNNKITVKTLCDNKVWSYKDNEVLISLIRKAQKENNLELEETYKSALFLVNQQMVAKIVHSKFPPNSFTKDDLFQEGLIGLGKALEKYDEGSGKKFITFATWWIRQSIMRFVYSCQTVRIPEYKHAGLKKFNDLKVRCHNNDIELTVGMVMKECECDELEAIDLMNSYNMMPASLNYERGGGESKSRARELMDDTSLNSDRNDPAKVADRNIISEKFRCEMKKFIKPEEYEVFELVMNGISKNKDIAKILHISESEARSLNNSWQRKLKAKYDDFAYLLRDYRDIIVKTFA